MDGGGGVGTHQGQHRRRRWWRPAAAAGSPCPLRTHGRPAARPARPLRPRPAAATTREHTPSEHRVADERRGGPSATASRGCLCRRPAPLCCATSALCSTERCRTGLAKALHHGAIYCGWGEKFEGAGEMPVLGGRLAWRGRRRRPGRSRAAARRRSGSGRSGRRPPARPLPPPSQANQQRSSFNSKNAWWIHVRIITQCTRMCIWPLSSKLDPSVKVPFFRYSNVIVKSTKAVLGTAVVES